MSSLPPDARRAHSRNFPAIHKLQGRSKAATLYKMFGEDGSLLYVGITTQGFTRIREHARLRAWWPHVVRIDIEHFATFNEASTRERELIGQERPPHNTYLTNGV